MKGSRQEITYAKRVKAAVDQATAQGRLPSMGARIEEILAEPLENYPDEVMSLDLLPTLDDFTFTGWTARFAPVECRQYLLGQQYVIDAPCPLVGWKPIRQGVLTGGISSKIAKFSLPK